MIQTTVKPVLVRTEQIEALRKIQEQERAKSSLGIAADYPRHSSRPVR